ncbi:hypothetical protein IP76_12190 [Rhizobium sp. AAP43]|nr:hypothetical protein IP76_12190 [Rhizobium sp. AAP43]
MREAIPCSLMIAAEERFEPRRSDPDAILAARSADGHLRHDLDKPDLAEMHDGTRAFSTSTLP